ncbi:MAG TPA: COX15/CtaA family protein, partial [Gallionella sp.]|nr:COX15/CtaA family protein [Gallionella sp.]
AIHWTHRIFAFAVVTLVAWVAFRALKVEGLRKTARWLLAIIALQFATGASTVFLNFPLALAVLHNGGAALLVLLLAMLNYKIRAAS